MQKSEVVLQFSLEVSICQLKPISQSQLPSPPSFLYLKTCACIGWPTSSALWTAVARDFQSHFLSFSRRNYSSPAIFLKRRNPHHFWFGWYTTSKITIRWAYLSRSGCLKPCAPNYNLLSFCMAHVIFGLGKQQCIRHTNHSAMHIHPFQSHGIHLFAPREPPSETCQGAASSCTGSGLRPLRPPPNRGAMVVLKQP